MHLTAMHLTSSASARPRHVALAAVVALLAALLAVAPTAPAQAQGQSALVINEVDYINSTAFVELHNPSGSAIDVGGLILDTDESDGTLFPFAVSGSVPAGGFAAVCFNGDNTAPFCDFATNETLDGSSQSVVLQTSSFSDIDRVGWNGSPNGEGPASNPNSFIDPGMSRSLSRCSDGADTDDNLADFRRAASTPGAANACPTLVVNEIDYVGGTDFFEIRNTSNLTVDLSDYSYGAGDNNFTVAQLSGTLAPGALTVVTGALPDDAGGIEITTWGSNQVLDSVTWFGGGGSFVDTEGTDASLRDPDIGSDPSGTHGLSRCGPDTDVNNADFVGIVATPGAPNACPLLRIGEVDYSVGTGEVAFVEILNVGTESIDLRDLGLLYPVDQTGAVDERGAQTRGTVLTPGRRATICFGDGPDATCTVELPANGSRPVDGPGGVAIKSPWSATGWDLMTWEGGGVFSGVEQGPATTNLSDPGPGMGLSRCPEPTDVSDLGATLPGFGVRALSPNAANVCTEAPALVINEVDHAGETDVIELYNPGAASVSLTGYSIVVDPPRRVIPLTGTIPQMGYRTICLGYTADECDQEVSGSLADGPSGVALRDGDDAVLDVLSWGGGGVAPDTMAEGGATTSLIDPGDPVGNSLSRCPNGTDTDVNTADFSLQARSPGVANPCTGPVVGPGGVGPGGTGPVVGPDGTVITIPTGDATATSIAFSLLNYPPTAGGGFTQAGPTEVLLASDTVFADALASGSLQADRPLLLNDPAMLEPAVLDEIQRLGATTVRVLGGQNAIADAVLIALQDAGLTVLRTFGPTRLETAEQIARLAGAPTGVILGRAFPAPGGDDTQAFADTLAAGGWAAAAGLPVLLSQTEVLSTTTQGYLDGSSVTTVRVVGGTSALSGAVTDGLGGLGIAGVRASGATRFETAVAIATARGFTASSSASTVVIVEGQAANAWEAGFTAAGTAAAMQAPVLLANGDALPQETLDFLTTAVTPTEDATTLVCAASSAACAVATTALGLDVTQSLTVDARDD